MRADLEVEGGEQRVVRERREHEVFRVGSEAAGQEAQRQQHVHQGLHVVSEAMARRGHVRPGLALRMARTMMVVVNGRDTAGIY